MTGLPGKERRKMTDSNRFRKMLGEWLKNPAWAKYYYGAPTERCRVYIALEFYYSDTEDGTAAAAMDETEAKMDAAELRYMYAWCGHNPRKGKLARMIAEREKREGSTES